MDHAELAFKKVRRAIHVVPEEHSTELKKELVNLNLTRLEIISITLILLTLATLAIDLMLYRLSWETNRGYLYLFYAHIILLLERTLYIAVVRFIKVKNLNYMYKFKSGLIYYSCAVTMAWCSYVSANAQLIHGQISAFIICNFCMATAIFLLPRTSLLLFISNAGLFMLVLSVHVSDVGYLAATFVNVVFIISFSFLMSYMNINLYTKNYIGQKIIHEQATELAGSRKKLEDTVHERTEDLIRANEQLIKEMAIRHEYEMQSIKTRLMYEENALQLNKIKESEELRNVFFANLSHELRTPLNVIFSAQQMMSLIIGQQSCDKCKNSLNKYNKIIKQNCYRLIRLIGNLIDITKIDAKFFEVTKRNCDIVKVVENITQSVAVYIKDKNIELSFDTEIGEKVIACDPDKIERIMLNLLSNAVKFTPEHGKIIVRMTSDGRYLKILVKDTGIGINEEMQKVIFERFVQADKSMSRNREGSGIGLSLVKSLVDLHQGKISLVSEVTKGSEFTVELPESMIPYEFYGDCGDGIRDQHIERIHIEFSDIYS